MLYIPRYREEANYIIVSKEDGNMDFYSKDSLDLLKQGKYSDIEKYKLFNLDNILKLKKEGKLQHFFSEEYLELDNPLKSPISISIEVTRGCNLSCRHCSVKAGKERANELTLEEIRNVIDQVKKMEIFSLFISGGECFRRNDILEILRYVDSLDIDCFVQTNGLLLTEELIQQIPKSIYLVISFDGINSCNKLHKSSFDFDKYDELFSILKKYNRNFTIQYVAYKDNIDELPKTYEYCKKQKIDLAALDLFCTGRANENRDIFPSSEQWSMYEKLASKKYEYEKAQQAFEREIFKDSPNPYHFAFIQKLQEIFERTYSGVFAMYVSSNGDVYPDVMHAGENMFKAGNIRESTLMELWNNSFKEIREYVKWKNWKKCLSCPLNKQFCDYRMPVLSFNLHKEYTYCGALPSQKEIMDRRYNKRESDHYAYSNDRARELDFW